MKVKVIEINDQVKMVTMDEFNRLVENNIHFKNLGTKEV